jgi:DNA-directed RNA polymerase II subunit RPB1
MYIMFDGDEMNIFLPQSPQARIEVEEIAAVEKNIITPALSVPIIGIVQDGLLGAYNMTGPNMKIDKRSAMNMLTYTTAGSPDIFKQNNEEIKGSDVFSEIIPTSISTFGSLEVKNGKITKGVLNKSMLGSKKPHSLIHLIWDMYGYEETRKFIDNTQKLINNFNMWNGFSVGIGDINVPHDVVEQLHKLFEAKKVEVEHLITETENNPDLIDASLLEETVFAELGALRDNASKLIMANLKPENNFNVMITSGSKGDPSNMGMMAGCIGQQAVEGKRIQPKFHGRTCPYYPQGADTADARGFIPQPYIKGATPINFIFHNMASREGLIDTAIKTAEL